MSLDTSQDTMRVYGMGEEHAKRAVKAANFAYKSEPLDGLAPTDLEGKSLILSDWMEGNNAEFRAAVTIDKETKQITYAVAGTRVDQGAKRAVADIRDDARLAAGFVPRKMASAAKLNQMLIDELGVDVENYTFNFTGHSLGAVMADCAATDMVLRLKKSGKDIREGQISTVTFDNPGAHTVVQEVCKNFHKTYPQSEKMDIEDVKGRCSFKAINNRDNFINTMDKQVGEKFTLVPKDQKPLNTFNKMCGWIARVTHSVPIVGAITGFLSHGRLKSQVNDHSLSNFMNVIVEQEGHLRSKTGKQISLDEAITGFEPIKYDQEIFDKIKTTMQKDKNPVMKADKKFSMTNAKGERIEFSPNQVVKAREAVYQSKPPKPNHTDLVVLDVKPQAQRAARKFTDMFKSKRKKEEFKIKTVDDVAKQIQVRSSGIR